MQAASAVRVPVKLRGKPLLIGTVAVMLLGVSTPASARIFSDGFESGDFSAWSQVVSEAPIVYRMTDLDLRDPHLFAPVTIVVPLCLDFTDDPLPVVDLAFNGSLQDQINTDADRDGFLDLSSLLLFHPFTTQAVAEEVDVDAGLCTAPLETTVCAADPMTTPLLTTYTGQAAGTCLDPVAGTTSGYDPAIVEPGAPCFVTVAETFSLPLGGLDVTLQDLQIAATFAGSPTTTFTSGLIRGFLTETAADALLLPPDLPVVGGQPFSVLLPGGTGSCATGDDRDTHLGESGWWFYLNFKASRILSFVVG